MLKLLNKLSRKQLLFNIPKGFMNIDVTEDNHLIADTNNSEKYDNLRIPLPDGRWRVFRHSDKEVILSAW